MSLSASLKAALASQHAARFGALGLLLLAALVVWLSKGSDLERSDNQAATGAAALPAALPPPGGHVASGGVTSPRADSSVAAPAPRPVTSEARALGELALGVPSELPSRPLPHAPVLEPVPAVDLPKAAAPLPPLPSVPPSTCGGLFVRLISAADDPKWASASVAAAFDAPSTLLRVGERINGFVIDKIEWDRVWVRSASERCAVGMHYGARAAEADLEAKLSGEQYARLPWVLPQEVIKGIYKHAEMEYELSEESIELLYQRGADVFAGLRIKPLEGEGLELSDVRLDSLLERLGVQSGDVLVRVDDQPVGNVDDVAKALEAARQATSLRVGMARSGEPFQLVVRVLSP